ncbi:MAG TPA: RNA polymerase factor sigma-54 [Rhizobacter sp.]|nr:RNA polymerase factor sigma-54 [Rhizobacter sp.]
MSSIVTSLDNRAQQKLSPRLQHAVRLLQLSSLEFAQEVHGALEKNPFLEAPEDEADNEAPADDPAAAAAALPEEPDETAASAEPDAAERDHWQLDSMPRGPASDAGGDADPMNLLAAETTLAQHLHGQLNVLSLPERDMVLAKSVVESLDDDGYLRMALEELIGVTDLDPPTTLEELQIALRRVQSLDPAGVGARNLSECLQLQVPGVEGPAQRELIACIVTDHLQALATKDLTALARALYRPVAEVDLACMRLRRFDPRPGWRFGSARTQYITPDIVVKKVRGVWTAALNPSILPKVRLNHVYAEMFQRHRAKNSELAGQLQEARWTVHNIEQRFATILSVAQAIVQRQRNFFDYGPMAMRPLGLREIADEVGLHESTVSRVTHHKYMATPVGVLELKYFFSRAMTAASGAEFSGTAVRGLVKDMIRAERPEAPLSDAEIARQLARQGLVVARRTVTKYRHLLKVESVERRRHGT